MIERYPRGCIEWVKWNEEGIGEARRENGAKEEKKSKRKSDDRGLTKVTMLSDHHLLLIFSRRRLLISSLFFKLHLIFLSLRAVVVCPLAMNDFTECCESDTVEFLTRAHEVLLCDERERVVLRCALCMAKRLRIKRQQSLVDHHMVQQHHTVFAWWWWWRWRMLFHSFLQSVQARYECFYFFFLHLFCFSLLHHSIPRSFRFQFSRSHQHELLHHVDSTVCVWVCTTDIDYDDNMKSSQLCWGSLCLPFAFIDRRRRFGRREGFEFRCWISNVHDILAFRPTLYVVCFFLLFGLLVDSGLLRSISILLNQFNRNEFIFRLVVRLLMHRLGCCCCDERRNWMANKIEFFFWLVCWLLLAEKSGEWS